MKNTLKAIPVMLLLSLVTAASARASVVYEYDFRYEYTYVTTISWRLVTSDFINTTSLFAADQLDFCTVNSTEDRLQGAVCSEVLLDPFWEHGDLVSTRYTLPLGAGSNPSEFADGSFSAIGDYSSLGDSPTNSPILIRGSLRIDCSPFPGGGTTGGCFPGPGPFPAPEPGTLALLGLGLLGLGVTRRKAA